MDHRDKPRNDATSSRLRAKPTEAARPLTPGSRPEKSDAAYARVVADDGLSIVKEIDLFEVPEEELPRLFPQGIGGFEWQVAQIEPFWRAHAPKDAELPEPLSLAWYAREILGLIERLRSILAPPRKWWRPHVETMPDGSQRREEEVLPNLEPVVLLAIRLGQLSEEAHWRFNRRTQILLGAGAHRTLKRAARNRGADIHEAAKKSDPQIRALAREFREQHPYSRHYYSTHWLAKQIARRLNDEIADRLNDNPETSPEREVKSETIRKRLRPLGLT